MHELSCENEFYLLENKKSFPYQRLSTYSRFDQRLSGTPKRLIANKHFFRIRGNEVSQAYNKSNVFWLFQIWNSRFWRTERDLVLAVPNIRIIDLRIIFANTEILDICFSKHWNSGFWLSQYWNSGLWPSNLWNSLC